MVLLENGKMETLSFRQGHFVLQAAFQVTSEGASTGEWDRFDPCRFFSSDASQCFYVWDVSKGIVPIYSNSHKQGHIQFIAQSKQKDSLLVTLNDRGQAHL